MISTTTILDLALAALVTQEEVGMTILTTIGVMITITTMESMMMIGEVQRFLLVEEDGMTIATMIDMMIGTMTTIHTMIDTMMMTGEVHRHLVVEECGMTIVTMIDMIIRTMMMIWKLPHKASRMVVGVGGVDRWLVGGPVCGIKPHEMILLVVFIVLLD